MTEDEQVRQLLIAAAEPDEPPPATPGPEFTDRARRALNRRRTAFVTAAAAVITAVAVAVPVALDALRDKETPPAAASADCVRETGQAIRTQRGEGYLPLRVTVLSDRRVPVDDGVTQGFGFRVSARESLSGNPAPSGTLTVSNPLHPEVIPETKDLVLMLRPAERRGTEGERIYEVASRNAYSVTGDGRVNLKCGGSTTVEQLRAAVTAAYE
ncbi:hypothetical protein ACFQ0X_02545 [Streptomyces rectiviolaceus]|uniref:Tat pathway signal sequence domain protein n=1 Tax=Streptomyces rectiviolaceus TaxID=332591 RepID=A0ABP6MDU1_9ACTN